MTTTFYDVIYELWNLAFPESVLLDYADILQLLTFVMTLILIFGVIIIPLWRVGTFFLRRSKR